jgi:hypothetical protein
VSNEGVVKVVIYTGSDDVRRMANLPSMVAVGVAKL